MKTTVNLAKRFRVVITKADGKRCVEFNKYSSLAEAEIATKALRSYGIDAQVLSPDMLEASG